MSNETFQRIIIIRLNINNWKMFVLRSCQKRSPLGLAECPLALMSPICFITTKYRKDDTGCLTIRPYDVILLFSFWIMFFFWSKSNNVTVLVGGYTLVKDVHWVSTHFAFARFKYRITCFGVELCDQRQSHLKLLRNVVYE